MCIRMKTACFIVIRVSASHMQLCLDVSTHSCRMLLQILFEVDVYFYCTDLDGECSLLCTREAFAEYSINECLFYLVLTK